MTLGAAKHMRHQAFFAIHIWEEKKQTPSGRRIPCETSQKKKRLLNSILTPVWSKKSKSHFSLIGTKVTSARSDQGLTLKPTSNHTHGLLRRKSWSSPSLLIQCTVHLPSRGSFVPPRNAQTSKSHNNAQ